MNNCPLQEIDGLFSFHEVVDMNLVAGIVGIADRDVADVIDQEIDSSAITSVTSPMQNSDAPDVVVGLEVQVLVGKTVWSSGYN